MSSDPGDEGFLQELRKNFARIQGYSSQIFVMLSLAPTNQAGRLTTAPCVLCPFKAEETFHFKIL